MADTELQELPAPHSELVSYIANHPATPMTELMEPYRKYESQLRSLFAQDPQNPVLGDRYLNLVPIFNEDTQHITTRARDLAAESESEKERYIMPLSDDKRRPNGSPAVVQSLQEFRKNLSIFSESSLAEMDWSNVVAAGSSVVNCLLPVPDDYRQSKRKLREYYHQKFCPASDVDLFLYGLTQDEAVEKIKHIERAVRDAILAEVTVVRTKHAITIASQHPTRHVQIVLRVYKSIGEILAGFDVDAAGGAYDGSQVWVTPRALQSFVTQINHVDLTRRSPSYENRLSKYSHRNFEVYWPELDRSRVDPTIFERSFQRTLGLARLLVLERLPTSTAREMYLDKRRQERGRPHKRHFRAQRLYGNIKEDNEDEVADWLEEDDVSNYHTFTIPYGPRYHARRIERLCYTRDLLLNAEFNKPKDREVHLHRHPAFFGRAADVMEDCCGTCPKPVTPEEVEVAAKEAEIYISGKLTFMTDNPGRQQIGSFNPLTDDDWTDMAYVGNTARLCQSIVDADVDEIIDWLAQEGADINQRDYTGRTPLHLAVISSTPEVVRCLVDHGARLTARLADGMTALHLAAERGNVEMVKILLDKSTANEADEEEKQDRRQKALREAAKESSPSTGEEKPPLVGSDQEDSDGELIEDGESELDVRSVTTGSFVKVSPAAKETQPDPELDESQDSPDFYTANVLAWDTPCSPLHLAIAEGHEEVVELLCDSGSDSLLPVKFLDDNKQPRAAILTLELVLKLPFKKAKSMALLLLRRGATSSQADMNGCTAFHRFAAAGAHEMIDTLFSHNAEGVRAAINHMVTKEMSWHASKVMAPLHSAISRGDLILVLKLLEAGAKPEIDFDTWLKAAKAAGGRRLGDYQENKKLFARSVDQPLIHALLHCAEPRVAIELLERGVNPNAMTTQSQRILGDKTSARYDKGETALDVVRTQIRRLRKYNGERPRASEPKLPLGMDEYLQGLQKGTYLHWIASEDVSRRKRDYPQQMMFFKMDEQKLSDSPGVPQKVVAVQDYLDGLLDLELKIIEKGGQSFYDLFPDISKPSRGYSPDRYDDDRNSHDTKKEPVAYRFDIRFSNVTDVTEIRKAAYIELFEAAWVGDLDKIKQITLTAWGPNREQPPLKIAVSDQRENSPFSLAFLRGHIDVAKAILEIVKLQYSPENKEQTRFKLEQGYGSGSEDSVEDSHEDPHEPIIVSEAIDKPFTIDNVGQVSMQVESHTRPTDVIFLRTLCFRTTTDPPSQQTLFSFLMEHDDHAGFKHLLDMASYFAGQKLEGDGEEELSRQLLFPPSDFAFAVHKGKTSFLPEIIKRTGAGLPLDHLVKKSGIDMKVKSEYYQGLTVYGKKRKDWAKVGRGTVDKVSGLRESPLLHAALEGSIESVEWFLSDAPRRHYAEFGQSKAAAEDPKLKHLCEAPGGFEGAISDWLGLQNELVLHCAVMGPPLQKTQKLIEYLAQACPSSIEKKSTFGETPLWLACYFGRTEFAKTLIDAGADQSVRNTAGANIVHAAVSLQPKAHLLHRLMEVLDPDLRASLMTQRSNLRLSGTTPLHAWVEQYCHTARERERRARDVKWLNKHVQPTQYETQESGLAVLALLLNYSGGGELEMLNGAGDTPLHTAVTSGNVELVEALLSYRPGLLYRENAVGRTPAEVARAQVTVDKLAEPVAVHQDLMWYVRSDDAANTMVRRDPAEFVAGDGAEKSDSRSNEKARSVQQRAKRRVWDVVASYLAKHPGKRRLVSLVEANDVAGRLGESADATENLGVFAAHTARSDEDEDEEGGKKREEHDFAARMRASREMSGIAWKPLLRD